MVESVPTLAHSSNSSSALTGAVVVCDSTQPTAEELQAVEKGAELLKLCKHSRPHNRTFKIDRISGQFIWASPRKNAAKTVVNLDDVREIRLGQTTKTFKAHPNAGSPDLSFSIVYGSKYDTLDIVAPSAESFKLWTNTLNFMVADLANADRINLFLRQAWRKADRNRDNELSLDEILSLLHVLNVNLSRKQVKETFDDNSTDGSLNFEGFTRFYRHLRYRKDVADLFNKYTKDHPGNLLVAEEFKKFLTDEQKFNATDEEVAALIAKYRNDQFAFEKDTLALDGFSRYLNEDDTEVMNPTHFGEVYQRMDLPLNYYFINSSHNTYLLKDQLRGPSSVEAYVQALSKGCRCVELDCWDGPDGDPIIYHGHTLTSKIKFRDAIKAINEYAFVASPYPVTLSLEVHCKLEQQGTMAKIMRETFADKLYIAPITSVQEKLPSPEALKNKILIKGKALPPEVPKDEDYESDVEEEDEEDDEHKDDPKAIEAKKIKEQQGAIKGAKVKVHKDLSDLVNCMKSSHFKSFEQTKEKGHPNEIFSFVEGKSVKFAKHHSDDYIQFNSISMTRTYPAGARVDSSNYDPVIHWNHGCQVVALNYQTYDRAMQINMGKFSDNGNCGYLIKPPMAMQYDEKIYTQDPAAARKITVRIISAAQLPKPNRANKGEIIDPLVEVDVTGVDKDIAKFKTKHIDDNGFNPVFNETFSFDISTPELALMRFVVLDKDIEKDEFIATRTIPVMSLMPGYRHVSLFDENHRQIQLATIYVHLTIV